MSSLGLSPITLTLTISTHLPVCSLNGGSPAMALIMPELDLQSRPQ